MVFDHATRELIRAWTNKSPEAGDLEKTRSFTDVKGNTIALTRHTTYLPGGKWKFRTAHTDEGFPVAQGSPILHHLDHPKHGPGWANKKPSSSITVKAFDQAMKDAFAPALKAELNSPTPWTWASLPNIPTKLAE